MYLREFRLTASRGDDRPLLKFRQLFYKPQDKYLYLIAVHNLIRGTNQSISKSEVSLISDQERAG